MLSDRGWVLSPAYDMNPVATAGGLSLNISKEDNSQDLELAKSVALYFRVEKERAATIIQEVQSAVKNWKTLAKKLSIPSREVNLMQGAFRLSDDSTS
jgi:serine/threonine-protein kinase HipA